ncbi:MAG: aminoglycoside adenylyltransferase domain-containing protein [Actinomycetota bacterium]
MPITQIPEVVARLRDALVAELEAMLGNRFVGLFLYGAVCFPPSPVADFDGHVLLDAPFDDEDRANIRAVYERLRSIPMGDEMDVYFVTIEDAAKSAKPAHQWDPKNVDNSWALHRAHVHAGRFVHVKGPDPRELLPIPTWPELDDALQGELSFVASHLDDAPAFCTLNLCRILASYESREVVMSKLQGAMWAIGSLDAVHHDQIRASLRMYASHDFKAEEDTVLRTKAFFDEMSARIAVARTS